jgi:hypothetical protein
MPEEEMVKESDLLIFQALTPAPLFLYTEVTD